MTTRKERASDEAFDLVCAARGQEAATLVRVLTASPLSVADLCALDAGDLVVAEPAPRGQVVLANLRRRGGTSMEATISIEAANELNCQGPFHLDDHLAEPVFSIPFTYGDEEAGWTTVRVRMPVSIATLLVADAGARAGIDVRPLLARGLEGAK